MNILLILFALPIATILLAIVLQHEIDHLHGILFYDHINKVDPWGHDNSLKIIE